jgi:hypothetical protein
VLCRENFCRTTQKITIFSFSGLFLEYQKNSNWSYHILDTLENPWITLDKVIRRLPAFRRRNALTLSLPYCVIFIIISADYDTLIEISQHWIMIDTPSQNQTERNMALLVKQRLQSGGSDSDDAKSDYSMSPVGLPPSPGQADGITCTPFSVLDILDPKKFKGRRTPSPRCPDEVSSHLGYDERLRGKHRFVIYDNYCQYLCHCVILVRIRLWMDGA